LCEQGLDLVIGLIDRAEPAGLRPGSPNIATSVAK
jgi:hypothetical protein